MAESFVFYESFQTAIERLPEDMQLEMYRAIVAYGINGEVYEGDNYVLAAMLDLIAANIDAAQKKREDGAKGGRSRKNASTLKGTSKVLSSNDNENDNDNENENENVDENENVNENIGTEPAMQASAISMPLNDGSEYPVFDNAIKEWEKLYPAVDVPQELRNMRAWLLSNRTKRKTKSGIERFINGWLAKEQNRGGRGAPVRDRGGMPKNRSPQDSFASAGRDLNGLVE